MTVPGRFRQIELQRAVKAVRTAGVESFKITIRPDGDMEILIGKAANDELPPVELE